MFKKILVALDGSDLSEAVLPAAEKLAEGTPAEIILIRAFQPAAKSVGISAPLIMASPPDLITLPQVREIHEKELEDARMEIWNYLEQRRAEVKARGFAARTVVIMAHHVAQAICDYASEENMDVIAMGTHGLSGLRRVVLGSVASAVLNRARVPVLLVRPARD